MESDFFSLHGTQPSHRDAGFGKAMRGFYTEDARIRSSTATIRRRPQEIVGRAPSPPISTTSADGR